MTRPTIVPDRESSAQVAVDAALAQHDAPAVLDAGCGSGSRIRIPDRAHLVGLDVSADGIGQNPRVDEQIIGDIQTFDLPGEEFAVIVCWDVLEHLQDPARALRNMHHALRPGGVMVIAAPNIWSPKGLLTKFSPYWFHTLVYRWAVGSDATHFPTYLRREMSPRGLVRFARRNHLLIRHLEFYRGAPEAKVLASHRIVSAAWELATRACQILTLGREKAQFSEALVILEKPAAVSGEHPGDRTG